MTNNDDRRLYALDALRLAAALAVLLHHWVKYTPADVTALAVYPTRLSQMGGYLGVGLFFIISGFVILMSAQGATAREFVFARIVRLYPAFWLCCTITYLVASNTRFGVDQASYAVSMTMFPAAFGHEAVDGVYWTLAVEAKFYLVIALLLAMGRLDGLPWCMAAWLAAGVLVSDPRIEAAFALNAAPFFAAGCACYLLRQGQNPARWALFGAAVVLGVLGAAAEGAKLAKTYPDSGAELLLPLIVAGMFGLMLAIAIGPVSLPRSRAVLAMGATSYPLYLLHNLLGWKALGLWATGISSYLAVLAGMLFLAWAVSHVFEPRGQQWLRAVIWKHAGVHHD